ncbi:hypothetical protein RUM44_006169 [Polyplax serrata]|uniref:Uncharacterized protein n=1 Tax=Polyplax serrata TaxID=468196 RepID=A0ABR1AZ75_POLSC
MKLMKTSTVLYSNQKQFVSPLLWDRYEIQWLKFVIQRLDEGDQEKDRKVLESISEMKRCGQRVASRNTVDRQTRVNFLNAMEALAVDEYQPGRKGHRKVSAHLPTRAGAPVLFAAAFSKARLTEMTSN